MSNTPIELKGSSFTLSVVHLHEAEPEVIRQALEDKIAQAPAFLKHAPVVINVSGLESPVNWPELHKIVTSTGLRIIGVRKIRHSGSSAAIVSPAVICGFLCRVYCWRFASGCYSAQWR